MADNPQRGALIRAARERKNWTQRQLAERCGVAPNTVYRWERGMLPPNDTNKLLLRDLLGISLVKLVTG